MSDAAQPMRGDVMIGTPTGAEGAANGELAVLTPGSARTVYLDREAGVVYKVEFERGANDDEIKHLELLSHSTLPHGVALPLWSTHWVVHRPRGLMAVVAMEFIDGRATGACCCHQFEEDPRCTCGDGPRMSDDLRDEIYELGLRDIGVEHGNVIEREGLLYLIDLDILHPPQVS